MLAGVTSEARRKYYTRVALQSSGQGEGEEGLLCRRRCCPGNCWVSRPGIVFALRSRVVGGERGVEDCSDDSWSTALLSVARPRCAPK